MTVEIVLLNHLNPLNRLNLPRPPKARRGSALIMALWTIAVLSIMVLSFATESHLYSGVNVFVRERNRVGRLIEPGQMLAEAIIAGYKDAPEWQDGEDVKDLLEDDRFVMEKRELKTSSKCTIGPILIDDARDKDGELKNPSTVKVEIQLVNAGEKAAINVNELYSQDSNYRLRWELLLTNVCGIPEDLEVNAKDAHYKGDSKVKLIDLLICSWNDWRDEDNNATAGEEGDECGAEKEWYEEYYEDIKADDEDRKFPRNAAIPDIKELGQVRGFKDFPAVLTGGRLYDNAETDTGRKKKDKGKDVDDEENPQLKGILDMLGTTGSAKINVNDCTVDQLLTVPGIGSEDEDDAEKSRATAQAIIDTLKVMPDYDVDETRTSWPYKDWDDLTQRVSDNADSSDVQIGNEANQYFTYGPDEKSIFKVTITGESMGMTKVVQAECYYNAQDKKIRYIKWRED